MLAFSFLRGEIGVCNLFCLLYLNGLVGVFYGCDVESPLYARLN